MANIRFTPGLLSQISEFGQNLTSPQTRSGQGLLTGAQQPVANLGQTFARNLGGLFGRDMRTPQEKLAATVTQKGLSSPEAMQAVLVNLAQTNPARAVEMATAFSTRKQQEELLAKKTEGERAISSFIASLKDDELVSAEARANISLLEKNFNLDAGTGTEFLTTELELRNSVKEEGKDLPESYQNYLLAVPESQRENIPYGDWLDRNKKTADNTTEMERAYNQARQDKTLPIDSTTGAFLTMAQYKNQVWEPSKSGVTSLTAEQKNYNAAVAGGYEGTFVNYLKDFEGKGKPEEDKLDLTKDRDGFLVHTRGPNKGKYFDPEARAKATEVAQQQAIAKKLFKESVIETLRSTNMVGINATIAGVQADRISPEEALSSIQLDPRLIEGINEVSTEAADARRAVAQRKNLLALYNENVPLQGVAGELALKSKEFLVGADNVAKFQFAEIANETANMSIPPGAASDIDVKRADRTVPTFTDSPEVIRSWLHNQMKKKALMAAEKEELAKYMGRNRGSAAGFGEYWATQTQTRAQIQNIFNEYGVPRSANYIRKTVQAGKELN